MIQYPYCEIRDSAPENWNSTTDGPMKSLSQVVWSEGMYLGPHEFQAQARYFEDAIQFAATALWFQCYGLIGCTPDSDALRNGTVNLVHASGIFPDGTPFLIPQSDAAPAARPIAELFPPTRDRLTVYLGITGRTPGGRNCTASTEPGDARYFAELRNFNDETNGADPRPVSIRRKNIRLLLEPELNDRIVSLPLARVQRDGSGHFIYDPDFVPPCLTISSSERLMLMLRRLIEILEAKTSALSRSTAGAGGVAEFSTRDLANFWLMHAVNSGLAALRHLWISKRGHPEELFVEMSRLGGALCTFALDSHPRTLPNYDHKNLSDCFEQLDHHIRTHLETIVPTNCVSIPLTRVANYFYEGEITDTRCLGRARWILGIHAQVGEAELIVRTPQLVKLCSAKFVGELVRRAMAGLALTHMPVPPPAVPARVEYQYFGVSRDGPFWDHIVQTHRVGIYVPGELTNAELELLAVLDKQA
jgi:type VI secretion system protein ImpJ